MPGTLLAGICGYGQHREIGVTLTEQKAICHQNLLPKDAAEMPHNSFHSETDLVPRARSGDHGAFEQLARRYSSRILATSRRILRNSADAEDNVQNVLVKAYTNLHQLQEAALLSTWLTRITINEALMKLRSSAAEKHRVNSATATEPAGKTPTEHVPAGSVQRRNASPENSHLRPSSRSRLRCAMLLCCMRWRDGLRRNCPERKESRYKP